MTTDVALCRVFTSNGCKMLLNGKRIIISMILNKFLVQFLAINFKNEIRSLITLITGAELNSNTKYINQLIE